MAERVVSDSDRALASEWKKRVDAALSRPQIKAAFERFDKNRKLLRGLDPKDDNKRRRTNLHFANVAAIRPQVYAKDPEFSVRPTKAVEGQPPERQKLIKQFCETSEVLLTEFVVKRAKLKKRAKRMLTAAFATSVGWWKVGWQQDKKTDPLIQNQIKDIQDNILKAKTERQALNDAAQGVDLDAKVAELEQTLIGLQSKAEVSFAFGFLLDFVMSEDIIVLDDAVRELADYERAGAIAHRVWMTRDQYSAKFGYDCQKGKSYTEISGQGQANTADPKAGLLCVYEIWDQASNRILTICDGEEGFCCPPMTPDWTGERWYPFFCLMFNEIDGAFYPLSDIELTEPLVAEYNEARDDFVRDRKHALPLTVIRKGGTLTPDDVKRIVNHEGGDTLVVEGSGGQPLSNDLWSGQVATIRPENYNTQPARADIEQIIGGGDAARGSVLEAKTATEAEILSQGLRGRTAERQDTMEDVLTDVGTYALQMLLRKLPTQAAKEIAGPQAVWPEMSREEVFRLVTIEVRGGSTGKPDRLQEQDRWTKLLPAIESAMGKVAELRATGDEQQAQAVIELTRETMRRFDERLDLETFLHTPKDGEAPADPMQDPRVMQLMQKGQAVIAQLQGEIEKLEQQVADNQAKAVADVRKAEIQAEADIRIAQITAPIEAQAKIDSQRAIAEAQASARVEAQQQEADKQAADKEAASSESAELVGAIAQTLGALTQIVQQLSQLAAAQSVPKPRMKVVHDRDPKTNRIAASRLVEDE